ncbi:MAG TPA: acyl-CoA dehydrogenase family protein [Candidatus Binataceae bacterium]|jgi:3-hydroxy-9,10-secoandrosta-1,3,5(10)-triene-9,17-dione monooxygenase
MASINLVESAKRIAPQLAETTAEDNSLRRLSDRTWKLLLEGGFVRSLQPVRWGGGEVSLIEFVDAMMEIARVSPSAGWVAGVIAVHPWQLALFDEKAQREMWDENPATMHSSSFNPTGKAEKIAGGYKLSGRWSFSSGCDHCRGVMLGAICGTREIMGKPVHDFRSFLVMPDQYRIDDNWHVAGLKGTGSKDVVVEDAFVPDYRSQSHIDYAMGLPLEGQQLNDGSLYQMPWSVVFHTALVSSMLGSARGFIDTWIAQTRDRTLSFGGRAADDPLTQQRLAEALWSVDATVARMRADILELSQMAEAREAVSPRLRAQVRWNMNRGCELIAQATGDLFRAATGRAVFSNHPLQQRFQDLQAAMAHAYMAPDPLARAVGGFLLGTSNPEIVF